MTAVAHLRPSAHLLRYAPKQLLRQIHELEVVAVGLVELQHREFGSVDRIHSFIAEVAVDFIYAVQSADDQPFQIEFGRDAKV